MQVCKPEVYAAHYFDELASIPPHLPMNVIDMCLRRAWPGERTLTIVKMLSFCDHRDVTVDMVTTLAEELGYSQVSGVLYT